MSIYFNPSRSSNQVHLTPDKFAKSSLSRRINELVHKIFVNFRRSAVSRFRKVSLDFKVVQQAKNTLSYRQLRKKSTLGSSAVTEYTQRLAGQSHLIVYNFLMNLGDQLPDKERNQRFALIPIVLKGFLRNHIVAVVFDSLENRIELYDSKGLVAKDRKGEIVGDRTLSDVLELVTQKYGDTETKLWENRSKHQKDSHNCGIYVLNYFERRVKGESPEQIQANGLTYSDANNSYRKDIVKILFS